MKKMNKYMVYVDDGYNAIKIAVPAYNEKEAKEYVKGSGEIIAVKDASEQYPIDANYLAEVLDESGFGKIEKDLIIRALKITGIVE